MSEFKDKDENFGLPKLELKPLDADHDPASGQKPKKGLKLVLLLIIFSVILSISIGFLIRNVNQKHEKKIEASDNYANTFEIEDPDQVTEYKEVKDDSTIQPVDSLPISEDILSVREDTVQRLAEKTGKYYLIVKSFTKEKNLLEYCTNFSNKNVKFTIIEPGYGSRIYKVAVGSYSSNKEALQALVDYRPDFGPEIWVLKH